MITVSDLCYSYIKKPFVENVNFNVGRGEIFGFLDPSGAGKSIIQKVLTELNTHYQGSIKVAGTDIKERTSKFHEITGATYIFPSAHGTSVISLSHFSFGFVALKSC